MALNGRTQPESLTEYNDTRLIPRNGSRTLADDYHSTAQGAPNARCFSSSSLTGCVSGPMAAKTATQT